MKGLLDPDSPFNQFLVRIADLCIINVLMLICCLPIITIAPACISLYDVIAHCIHGPDEHPYKRFFRTFKAELLRGIGISVLWGVIGFVLMMGYNVLYQLGKTSPFAAMYSIIYLASMLIPIAIFGWLIPIESRFTHSFGSLHKTAATFAIVHLPTTGIILGLLAIGLILIFFVPALAFLMPGILVTLQCWFIEKVFKKYIPQEDTDDTAE